MNYLKRYKYLSGVLIFTIVNVAFSMLVQYKRADLLDIAVNRKQGFLTTAILFVIFILFEIICTYFMNDFSKKYAIHNSKEMREKIYERYSSEKVLIDANKKSEFINIETQQIDLLKENYYMQITLLIFLLLKSVIIVFLMMKVNIILTFVVVLMLLTQVMLPKLLGNKLKEYNQKYIVSLEKYTKTIEEFMSGYRLIFSFSSQKMFNKKFIKSLDDLVENDYKNFKYNNVLRNINMLVSYSTHFIAIILCTYLLFINVLDIKNAYLLIGFVEQLSYPLVGISFAYQSVISFKNTRAKIVNEATETNNRINLDTINKDEKVESISLENLSINYNDNHVIKNYTKKFNKDKKYLLCGRSGVGKTTILNVLTQGISKYSGDVFINDINYKETDINNVVGLMNDTPIFLNDTLRNNLLLGYNMDNEYLINILNSLNLGYLNSRLDEEIDNSNNSFSLGERKRIELARVLIRNYPILLLDEPTSNIDDASKVSIINLIKNINDKIVICTSHDNNEQFLNVFDEIIELR